MLILKIILLAIVQGLAELLPVSSSAHVIVAEKLMGLDPTTPQMTLLLVMLHTGTMFAVIVYFWKRWAHTYFRTAAAFTSIFIRITLATILTGAVGYPLKKIIEKTMMHGGDKAEIEQLFGRLDLIAIALFCAGVLILVAGLAQRRFAPAEQPLDQNQNENADLTLKQSSAIGLVQGLCLPFRGFSRSGATISVGMLSGVAREAAETFSFALAVVLTPPVVAYEALRLVKASHAAAAAGQTFDLHGSILLSLLGMVFSFLGGLLALKWLSAWLESGKWYLFGIYCLVASAVIFFLFTRGF
jgi:undecaprenyl-diphosphatase